LFRGDRSGTFFCILPLAFGRPSRSVQAGRGGWLAGQWPLTVGWGWGYPRLTTPPSLQLPVTVTEGLEFDRWMESVTVYYQSILSRRRDEDKSVWLSGVSVSVLDVPINDRHFVRLVACYGHVCFASCLLFPIFARRRHHCALLPVAVSLDKCLV
jgi:hypothetical protein